MRTRRVRPASVRTSADGISPPGIDSTTAISPLYSPPPMIRTRRPMVIPSRPLWAFTSIATTLGRTYVTSGVSVGAGRRLVRATG